MKRHLKQNLLIKFFCFSNISKKTCLFFTFFVSWKIINDLSLILFTAFYIRNRLPGRYSAFVSRIPIVHLGDLAEGVVKLGNSTFRDSWRAETGAGLRVKFSKFH